MRVVRDKLKKRIFRPKKDEQYDDGENHISNFII
jgi:hypothetical protein